MIFVGLVAAIIGKQAIRQTVRLAVFNHTVAASSVIFAADFRTYTLFNARALHHSFPRLYNF